jgi:uncharacterized DUF497 family protein
MGDFSGRDKLERRGFDTVEESMRGHYMDPDDKREVKEYADALLAGDIASPLELRGDTISQNGACEWDKKKAFINKYKHGVTFEQASLAFSENPPPGYGVLYDDPNDDGTGFEAPWGIDIRDQVVARLGGSGCVMVKVDRDNVKSGRVRLISVRWVSEKEVMKAIQEHEINSSVSVLARAAVASHPYRSRAFKNKAIRSEVNRRIQVYENIRYLAHLM